MSWNLLVHRPLTLVLYKMMIMKYIYKYIQFQTSLTSHMLLTMYNDYTATVLEYTLFISSPLFAHYLVSVWFVHLSPCVFLFFFFNQRLLYCSFDMNSAFRLMNSNRSMNNNFFIIFFIVFNFHQNKQYPNRFLLQIEVNVR